MGFTPSPPVVLGVEAVPTYTPELRLASQLISAIEPGAGIDRGPIPDGAAS